MNDKFKMGLRRACHSPRFLLKVGIITILVVFLIYKMKIAPGYHPTAQLSPEEKAIISKQLVVDYISIHMHIQYGIISNSEEDRSFTGEIILTNDGEKPIKFGHWRIYFSHMRQIERGNLDENHAVILGKMRLTHLNGYFYMLQPTPTFDLQPGGLISVRFQGAAFSVAKSDIFPNWYVSIIGATPKVIANTHGENNDMIQVGSFDAPDKWKRSKDDTYNPWTLIQRFNYFNEIQDLKGAPLPVVPTPAHIDLETSSTIQIDSTWRIHFQEEAQLMNEALYLKKHTGAAIEQQYSRDNQKTISLQIQSESFLGVSSLPKELTRNLDGAYNLKVIPQNQVIIIMATTPAGIFNGIVSLIQMMKPDKTVPKVSLVDAPRFAYRGLMLDVARNFHDKKSLLIIIDIMGQYKLNKLHLHLTDDEGWRLDIEGLSELVTIGGTRCHSLTERACVLPQLGSGPFGGSSGRDYYTASDYKEILRYAKDRHIEIIPEFDLPGHSHAAIKAMQERHRRQLLTGNKKEAVKFLLSDPDDTSEFISVQGFRDNVVNPCLESSYTFVDHIMATVKELHKDISPLRVFHLGGDEVPGASLKKSPICKQYLRDTGLQSTKELKVHFIKRVAEIAKKHQLELQMWGDGMKDEESEFFKKQKLSTSNVTANVWQNMWDQGIGNEAYKLANLDYKVVVSLASHLYLDMAQEPDPEERGLYWAVRYLDTRTVHGFIPDSIYDNIKTNGNGQPLTKDDTCITEAEEKDGKAGLVCVPLQKRENIIGISASLWSEVVRTPDHLQSQLFPRLIAVAERAWHKAEWEDLATQETENKNRVQTLKDLDWQSLANTLGYRELERLDNRALTFHMHPPGVKVEGAYVKVRTAYPGLPVQYSSDDGASWQDVEDGQVHTADLRGKYVKFATRNYLGTRRSRSVVLQV